MFELFPITAYIAPDAALPFTSVIAALVGAVLILWQRIVLFFRSLACRVGLLSPEEAPAASASDAAPGASGSDA